MMRLVYSLFLITLLGTSAYAEGDKNRKSLQVQIVSDEFDKKVPNGKCKVTGEVYYHGELYQGAEVCSYKGQECVKTNKKGVFSIVVDTSEIHVYASIIGAKTSYLNGFKFNSQHHVQLRFYIEDSDIKVRKPVIYLYSDEESNLELKLKTEVELSFTYPEYEGSWDVSVNPEKGLSVDGKHYPYLFWEGNDYGQIGYPVENEKIVGELIQTDTVVSYLENRVQAYGLNEKEATDFITFWGPILAKEKYAFVRFLLDEEYDQIASIECSKQIDNERRVFMMYESFDSMPDLQVSNTQLPVTLFHREGLVLVEWGGAEVTVPKL